MVIQPSAKTSSLLKGVVLSLKVVEKPVRKEISDQTRRTMNPVWQEAIATHAAGSRLDYRVMGKGARIAAGNPARAIAASSRRPLRKGTGAFIPNDDWRQIEFGTNPEAVAKYRRKSKNGGTHEVTRHTRRGMPARNSKGRVVYPAVAEVAPRLVSLWVQIVVRNIHKSLEER